MSSLHVLSDTCTGKIRFDLSDPLTFLSTDSLVTTLVRRCHLSELGLYQRHASTGNVWSVSGVTRLHHSVRSDEFGRDLSSVQTLLTKQETFDIGLRAFETEGIQNISALKDQLIGGNHVQADAINKKFNVVINRWNKLLAESQRREQRLLEVQDQFRQIEELYLTFAKKASAFNSWFENAEEDMTDPVRCNSVEEIRSVIKTETKIFSSMLTEIFLSVETKIFFVNAEC